VLSFEVNNCTALQERYHQWYSNQLSAQIEMLEFGHAGFPVILFPTSMGRYYENKDFQLIESVRWFIEQGLVRIYCPDSIDHLSWYNKSIHPAQRVQNHIWYDQMLINELIPSIQHHTGFRQVALAGCSFGGYHATNFAFRYPHVSKYVINMGAAFDIKGQLDGFYNNDVYFNNPPDFIQNINSSEFNHLNVILGTGTWDICLDANLKFAEILRNKQIKHWLDVRHEANHDWPVWKSMFPHYLSLIH
jgi:esterase/lipase superfamily enzyme